MSKPNLTEWAKKAVSMVTAMAPTAPLKDLWADFIDHLRAAQPREPGPWRIWLCERGSGKDYLHMTTDDSAEANKTFETLAVAGRDVWMFNPNGERIVPFVVLTPTPDKDRPDDTTAKFMEAFKDKEEADKEAARAKGVAAADDLIRAGAAAVRVKHDPGGETPAEESFEERARRLAVVPLNIEPLSAQELTKHADVLREIENRQLGRSPSGAMMNCLTLAELNHLKTLANKALGIRAEADPLWSNYVGSIKARNGSDNLPNGDNPPVRLNFLAFKLGVNAGTEDQTYAQLANKAFEFSKQHNQGEYKVNDLRIIDHVFNGYRLVRGKDPLP